MTTTPFFLRFVETSPAAVADATDNAGDKSPTAGPTSYWRDKTYEPTLKYPSDDDEVKF